MRSLVVGFDLDMTLVDSARAIVDTLVHVCGQHGVALDPAEAYATVGLPLDAVFPRWLPDVPYETALAAYRARYAEREIPRSAALPGAADALAAVRAAGGRVLVVTAKKAEHATAVLDAAGLAADTVVGERFAERKGEVLAEHGAWAYVGDHVGDVLAARVAGALAVGVPTGPTDADALTGAGADVVLDDLTGFPAWLEAAVLTARLDALAARLRDLGSVLVAFSGGADSAFVLAAAVRALGPERVVAATGVSPSLARGELDAARAFAASLGVRHVAPATYEGDRDGYVANAGDRCAFCKTELMTVLGPLAADLGLAHVVTGTNADDVRDAFRPGVAAAAGLGARTPLADAGLTKAEVRRASLAWGLPTWDKPQAACLASRIAYGVAVTPERLARVDAAEAGLREVLRRNGIVVRDLRVRDLGDRARIEVDPAAVPGVTALPAAREAVRAAGFDDVEVDARGFRSGALNELLPLPTLRR